MTCQLPGWSLWLLTAGAVFMVAGGALIGGLVEEQRSRARARRRRRELAAGMRSAMAGMDAVIAERRWARRPAPWQQPEEARDGHAR